MNENNQRYVNGFDTELHPYAHFYQPFFPILNRSSDYNSRFTSPNPAANNSGANNLEAYNTSAPAPVTYSPPVPYNPPSAYIPYQSNQQWQQPGVHGLGFQTNGSIGNYDAGIQANSHIGGGQGFGIHANTHIGGKYGAGVNADGAIGGGHGIAAQAGGQIGGDHGLGIHAGAQVDGHELGIQAGGQIAGHELGIKTGLNWGNR